MTKISVKARMLLLILSVFAIQACFGQECYTNDEGPVKNSSCVFPFTVGRRRYEACTNDTDSEGLLWCSTQVDKDGKYIDGLWGYCILEGK